MPDVSWATYAFVTALGFLVGALVVLTRGWLGRRAGTDLGLRMHAAGRKLGILAFALAVVSTLVGIVLWSQNA